MNSLPPALAPMGAYSQWIVWRLVNGKKLPYNPNTLSPMPKGADWQKHSEFQTDFQTAASVAELAGAGYGVGFVFTDNDPFVFIDIDHCLIDGKWSAVANDLMTRCSGAAVEVSQSGTGLHIFGQATDIPEHGCKNIPLGIELYHTGRFVAMTGDRIVGSSGVDLTGGLPDLVQAYFPPSARGGEHLGEGPVPEWSGPTDDDALIERMLSSVSASSAFKGRATVRDLWEANEDALAGAYPDPGGHRAYDASSADAALAQHLAFWTGRDADRIERLMRRSALYREKYDRPDYLPRTIAVSVSRQKDVLGGKARGADMLPAPVTPAPAVFGEFKAAERSAGGSNQNILTPELQTEFFAGCVYVQFLHRVWTPHGALLKPEQFNATYGGYIFALDAIADKTTRKAFEAFTESQAITFPKAVTTRFRPDLPPGANVGGDVNTFMPIDAPRKQGDPEPFLEHLRKVLPDERDQRILLSYLAACVQHAGVKFQWAPLLQGFEGNGKSLFTRCLREAVGPRYYHSPRASQLGGVFNAWMKEKLVIGVEDIFVAEHRAQVLEDLKPMITGEDTELRQMQTDAYMIDLCANFIFNSNYKDALREHVGGRRYAIFFTPQQDTEDLTRDGMTGDYFPNLYDWLKGAGKYKHLGDKHGYAIVTEFLNTYPIDPEFNPAGACNRAPRTSSTDEAIAAGRGRIEQEVLEAIEQGRPGFTGGFISSIALDAFLKDQRFNLAPNKRRHMLGSIGYIPHPTLQDGRATRSGLVDGGRRPRLYVRADSDAAKLQTAEEVMKAYEQGWK